jgi:hypothetical protein
MPFYQLLTGRRMQKAAAQGFKEFFAVDWFHPAASSGRRTGC